MKNLPYMRWFPADADADEKYASMSDEQLGFFHRCLNKSWINNGLPADMDELASLMHISRAHLNKRWGKVGRCWYQDGDRLYNRRQEEERTHVIGKSKQATEAVQTRYKKATSVPTSVPTGGIPRALARDSESDTESEEKSACAPKPQVLYVAPLRRALPASKLNGHGAEWSAALYARHPKKKDEALVGGALFRVMEEVSDPSALFQEIDRVHRLWCATFDWSEKNGRFAPVLAAWLLDHGWTVEPHEDRSELERMMDRI